MLVEFLLILSASSAITLVNSSNDRVSLAARAMKSLLEIGEITSESPSLFLSTSVLKWVISALQKCQGYKSLIETKPVFNCNYLSFIVDDFSIAIIDEMLLFLIFAAADFPLFSIWWWCNSCRLGLCLFHLIFHKLQL